MKVDHRADGATHIECFAPALVIVFETEASGPTCSYPRDPAQLGRILGGLDPRWRELVYTALDVEQPEGESNDG